MSGLRDSRRATRGHATLPRKGASHHHCGGASYSGSHENGVGSGDVDGVQKYTSGRHVIYRGKGRNGHVSGKRKHAENGVGLDGSPVSSVAGSVHTSGRHAIHRGGGLDGSPISGDVAVSGHTSGRHAIHRGGALDGSPISGDVAASEHTSRRHTIHRGRGLDCSPISGDVAASGHTSGRHAIHQGGGLDVSPISGDVVASGRHVASVLDEITGDDDDDDDDDAYSDSEYDVDHPSRQNSFNRDVPRETSGKQFIERIGDKFADHDIHSKICDILLEHYDGPWATFRKVPKDVVISMFARFGTLYCWDPENEQLIYDAFRNVIKDRFRDIMSEWRVKSKKKAKDAGHVIGDKEHKFDIICSFPPDSVSSDVWQQLCLGWNTEKWLNKSASGRRNRTKEGTGGGISRHTGGSIGFDERRIRLEKKHGRKVKWIEVFFDTHLTKESKKKYWAGELNINSLEGFEFCTEQSKQAFVRYKSDMIKLHGPDLNQHPDDLDVWEKVAKRSRRRMFGIGSSDPHFVVTGKPSTFSGSTSYFGVIRSQEEVQKVRAEMETQLEDERKSRNELEERVQRMEQLEKERMKNEEMRQKQFEELMKKFQPSRSN